MVFHQQTLLLCSMQTELEVKITFFLVKLGIILIFQEVSSAVSSNANSTKHLHILVLLVDQMQEDLINKGVKLYLQELPTELLLLQTQNFKASQHKLSIHLILLLLLEMYQHSSHQAPKLISQFTTLLLKINLLNSVVLNQLLEN